MFWEAELAARYPTLRRGSVLNDGYAAIRCGEPSGVGVVIQAGTAGAVAPRGRDGAPWDLGLWTQHHLGGSGLAHEARRAVYLAELGLGPQTVLTEALTEFYGKRSATELNHWFSRREGGAPPLAGPRAAYAGVGARRTGLAGPDAAGGKVSVVFFGSVLMAEASPETAALLEDWMCSCPEPPRTWRRCRR
ncbi:hypothetical protein [Streptomyces chiangmaiensis]|uniref:Uncharacterized protein n=1 Tax=Streptomyces chiangmaiensis TaxID=766497 RepID=A0ABU7FQ70_9ACTN|nr:hypothetical protein [Streptomyces chiangmaiensis]MED7826227.1 hypothetical protein [Streptomyces chiangmaiensis]